MYTFHVTQEDIEAAIPSDSSHCVIADTIAHAIGKHRVHVDLQTITFTDPEKRQRLTFLTPEVCQDHLLAFDQGEPVAPFTFTLRRPIQVRKMGMGGGTTNRAATEARNAKLADLQAKRDAGEPMTKGEKGALTFMERTGMHEPVQAYDPKTVKTFPNDRPIVHGGKPLPKAVLSNGKGRVRRYGLRQAKPGVSA